QGARNGRGAHHQLVRLATLAREREALRDAVALLLVDDREAELREGDALLEERMGPYRELRLPARDRVERRLLRACLEAPGNPRYAHAQRLEPVRELEEVLLGEDFGRRHQRRLPAVLDGLQRRERRDQRLAAADVALQQTAHRVRLRELLGDRVVRAAL